MAETERDRTMVRPNDDDTCTVVLVRTIRTPKGPIARDRDLESDTLDIMRRHATAFMFPLAKRKRTDRNG